MRLPRLREARDHPPRRAVASAGATNPGDARHPPVDLLSLVRSVSSRRARGARRSSRRGRIASGTASPTMCASASSTMALDSAGAVAARAGHALHRRRRLFCLGSFGLSPAQGPRPDHQPGLHRHQGGRRVQGQDHSPQPALADRLHLPQGHRLGLVLSVDHPRRLLALHHRLEAVHDHAGRRRHRHAAAGAHGIRLRIRRASCTNHGCSATTAPATSPATWPNGSKSTAWTTCAARPAIPRPRARSSAGTRRSRTASCSRTTTCPATSKRRSIASSITTITAATTRACSNLTPADVYFGRGQTILLQRERIKRETIKQRRLQHQRKAA